MRRARRLLAAIRPRRAAARTVWGTLALLTLTLGAFGACRPAAMGPALGPGLGLAPAYLTAEAEHDTLERALFWRVRLHRDSLKLPRLHYDERLADLAREHSRAMASGLVPFSHQGFHQRAIRAGGLGYPRLGENLAFNAYTRERTVEVAVVGLVGSPPHRRTMEGDWHHSGVGVARSENGTWYYTQLFARK
jgi:uncharacterized protein YkwD